MITEARRPKTVASCRRCGEPIVILAEHAGGSYSCEACSLVAMFPDLDPLGLREWWERHVRERDIYFFERMAMAATIPESFEVRGLCASCGHPVLKLEAIYYVGPEKKRIKHRRCYRP
jgi:hypothetical protein